jgi:hypothetical protein
MKVSKFLTIASFITCFCLLYVYQQTEIFRMAYVGQKKVVLCEDLLDKNSVLRYNIESSASLVHIGSRVSGSADFQMPESYRLVRLSSSGEGLNSAQQPVNKETFFSRIFGVRRQAEAKTIP